MAVFKNGLTDCVCLILCLTSITVDGLITCQGRRYKITKQDYPWDEAASICASYNGNLATPPFAPGPVDNNWKLSCPTFVSNLEDTWMYLMASPSPNDCGVLIKDGNGLLTLTTQPHDSPTCVNRGRLICEKAADGPTTALQTHWTLKHSGTGPETSSKSPETHSHFAPPTKGQHFELVASDKSPPSEVPPLRHVTTGSPLLCGMECLKLPMCDSFLLLPSSSQCSLYAGNHLGSLVAVSVEMEYFTRFKVAHP